MSGEPGPDAEGALKDYLRQHSGVTATACGQRIFLAASGPPTFPWVRITRFAGGEDPTSDAPIDFALVQIDVLGRVKQLDEANTVRRAIRVALSQLDGTPYTATGKGRLLGAIVRDDRRFPESDAQDSDGTIGERPRYIVTVELTCIAD